MVQEMQLQLSLHEISLCRERWLRSITSGASHLLTTPSDEQVANVRPICMGANFTLVMDVLLSARVVLFTPWLCPHSLSLDSPAISSHTTAVPLKEQEAETCPHSGWATSHTMQITAHLSSSSAMPVSTLPSVSDLSLRALTFVGTFKPQHSGQLPEQMPSGTCGSWRTHCKWCCGPLWCCGPQTWPLPPVFLFVASELAECVTRERWGCRS